MASAEYQPGRHGPMGATWVPVLAQIPLFSELSKSRLKRVASLGRLKRFVAHETIMREDEAGNSFFLILEGTVSVRRAGQPAVTVRDGEFLGELALLTDAPRTATVTADKEVLAMRISREDFQRMLRTEPKIALVLLSTLATRLVALQSNDPAHSS